jgi:hypothetical protein
MEENLCQLIFGVRTNIHNILRTQEIKHQKNK